MPHTYLTHKNQWVYLKPDNPSPHLRIHVTRIFIFFFLCFYSTEEKKDLEQHESLEIMIEFKFLGELSLST